jgi:ABC transporter DrrB family efflux protein
MAKRKQDDELVFLPLGGSNEIGMNFNLYGYGPPHDRQWIVVDLGVTFGDQLTPGVEVILPDPAFIEEHAHRILGIVLTHAHEDHIGAVAWLWPRLKAPVYATPFTAFILREKLREADLLDAVKITEVPLGGTIELGPFSLDLITLTHSIPEPNGLAIRTPLGVILHTGDWKIDPDPLLGGPTDSDFIRKLGDEGVLAMVCDSTNVFVDGHAGSEAEVRALIERGDARAAVIIPPEYATDIKRRRTAHAQVIVDAADPLASSAAIGAASQAGVARSLAIAGDAGARMPLEVRVRPWYNPALESAIYIVPGVIGLLLTLTMTLITAMAIVRERERGTLEQLIVTPITRTGVMLGKTLPFVVVGYVQMTVILLLGHFVFGVPIRGSLTLLYAISFLYIMASLAFGLFVSTIASTQAQAMQLSFLLILPTILLSGFMFPREAMPVAAQWLGSIFPITYFLRVLRGILLKGAGVDAIWQDSLALGAFGIILVALSALRFHKTLE